jgi:hypothetical protein
MMHLPDVIGGLYGHRGSPLVTHEGSPWKLHIALNNGPPISGSRSGLRYETYLRFASLD